MTFIILPSGFTQPELFIPRRKPTGPVKIDWAKSMSKGLISLGIAQLANVDLVGNVPLQYFSNVPEQNGDFLHFNDTRNSECIQLPHLGNTFLDGATEFTMMVHMRYHPTGTSVDEDSLIGQLANLQGSQDINAQRVLLRYSSISAEIDLFAFDTALKFLTVSKDLKDDNFHRVWGLLRDGFLLIYADGVQITGSTALGALQSASHSKFPEVMGAHNTTFATNDSPRIDLKDWAIWDRGLSSIEIATYDYQSVLIPGVL